MEAQRRAEEAVAAAETAGDRQRLTTALIELGAVLDARWEDAAALAVHERAAREGSGPAVKTARGRLLLHEGRAKIATGDLASAEARLLEARDLARALDDVDLTARTIIALGALYAERGDFEDARSAAEAGLIEARSTGNPQRIAMALYNLGWLASWSRADHPAAEKLYQQTLAAACAAGDRRMIALAHSGLAQTAVVRGDFTSALATLHRSRDTFEAGGFSPQVVSTLTIIGSVYGMLGDDELSRRYLERSLALAEQIGDKLRIAIIAQLLANLAARAGEPDRAGPFLERALRLAEEVGAKNLIAEIYLGLAQVHSLEGRWQEAESAGRRSIALSEEIGASRFTAIALADLAFMLADVEERAQAAISAARQAARMAAELDFPNLVWKARGSEGRALLRLGRRQEAEAALAESIEVLEALYGGLAEDVAQRQRFFEQAASIYRQIIGLSAAGGRLGEAFSYAERLKARALLDALGSGRPQLAQQLTVDDQQRETRLRAALSDLNRRLLLARTETVPERDAIARLETELAERRFDLESFRARLYAGKPGLARRRGEIELRNSGALAALLPPHTALLEYAVLPDRTLVFVLTRAGLSLRELPGEEAALATEAEEFRRRLAERNLDIHPLATRLFRRLLEPVLPALDGVDHLIIVPDGPLWDLPFQALESSAGRFVIEDRAISYVPSANVLAEMLVAARTTAPTPPARRLLALGNPSLGTAGAQRVVASERGLSLDPLPAAETEVRAIGRLYGDVGSRVLVGAEASEERVKREVEGYQILHLASHGLLDAANPMYSQILLAHDPAGQDDGLLEVWEMMELPLDAELVVLSGCQTARGRITPGEGLIGMSWALFVAGAPAVVASQWAVDSTGTEQLMVELHRQMLRGEPKAQALRRAARSLMAQAAWRHPYYWAGFILLGDGSAALSPARR